MEKRKKKIYTAAALTTVLMLGTTGCKSNTNAQGKSSTVENQAGNQIEKETFAELLEKTDDIEELYTYIENNAEGATKEEWSEWIKGVVDFSKDDVEYDRFQKYMGSMSEEMKSFVELMSAEQTRPSFNEEGVQLTLGEILERCIAIEQHIADYGQGDTYSILYHKYCQLMNIAITGGYDGVDIETNEYLEEDKQHIETSAIEEYKRVISDYPDSQTADILDDYLDILEKNENVVNQKVEKYYEDIYQKIGERFS